MDVPSLLRVMMLSLVTGEESVQAQAESRSQGSGRQSHSASKAENISTKDENNAERGSIVPQEPPSQLADSPFQQQKRANEGKVPEELLQKLRKTYEDVCALRCFFKPEVGSVSLFSFSFRAFFAGGSQKETNCLVASFDAAKSKHSLCIVMAFATIERCVHFHASEHAGFVESISGQAGERTNKLSRWLRYVC